MRKPPTYRAAWVPTQTSHDDEDRLIGQARAWLRTQQRECGGAELLVQHTKRGHESVPALRGMTVASLQSRADRSDPWLVLAWMADEKVLEAAQPYAQRTALVAFESATFPLHGWARATGAVDLTTGQPAEPLTDDMLTLLEHLQSAGNNGFGHPYGKKMALALLPDLFSAGATASDILGYVLAHGQSVPSVQALQRLLADI
jgi:hypothetical protein